MPSLSLGGRLFFVFENLIKTQTLRKGVIEKETVEFVEGAFMTEKMGRGQQRHP